MIEHLDALSGSPSLFSAWKHHAPSSPPLLCLPVGILVIEHLDALALSLERLDLSRNRLTLVDSLGALTGLRELRLGHNQM